MTIEVDFGLSKHAVHSLKGGTVLCQTTKNTSRVPVVFKDVTTEHNYVIQDDGAARQFIKQCADLFLESSRSRS